MFPPWLVTWVCVFGPHAVVVGLLIGEDGSGRVINQTALDSVVRREILDSYDHRYLNEDVPEYRELNPTTENMVAAVRKRLEAVWPPDFPKLVHVRIQETKRNVIELAIK